MLEGWIQILVNRWTEELGTGGCNKMIIERAHVTLEDAVMQRNVYDSLVIQAKFGRLSWTFRWWVFLQTPSIRIIFALCNMAYIALAFFHDEDTRMFLGFVLVFPFTVDVISSSIFEFQVLGSLSTRTRIAIANRIAIYIFQILALATPDVRSSKYFVVCQNLLRPCILINRNPEMGECSRYMYMYT